MAAFRALLRSIKLALYFAAAALELLLTRPNTPQARADWLHRFCARMLRGFGVKLTVEGSFPPRGALISNHLSYLDIVVYAALSPVVYCARAEMEHWPIIGWMTRMAGTVFVDRGAGGSSERAKTGMLTASRAGVPVTFFPEGTTTDGTHILPFRSGLLAQALAAGEPVTAARIAYTLAPDPRNGDASAQNQVCWGDDTPLLRHILRFNSLVGVRAHVRIASQPIPFSSPDLDRKQAAAEARDAVVAMGASQRPAAAQESPSAKP